MFNRSYTIHRILIFLIIGLNPFTVHGQHEDQKDSTIVKLMTVAREIMSEAPNCALITINEGYVPMVRVMDPFPPEDDFTVWLGTNPKSRKVKHIKRNSTVTLYYLDRDASGYVVVHGKAYLVNDREEKTKHWKEEWEAFYPNIDEDYLLIKVVSGSLEVLSYSRGITGDPVTWQVPMVKLE